MTQCIAKSSEQAAGKPRDDSLDLFEISSLGLMLDDSPLFAPQILTSTMTKKSFMYMNYADDLFDVDRVYCDQSLSRECFTDVQLLPRREHH